MAPKQLYNEFTSTHTRPFWNCRLQAFQWRYSLHIWWIQVYYHTFAFIFLWNPEGLLTKVEWALKQSEYNHMLLDYFTWVWSLEFSQHPQNLLVISGNICILFHGGILNVNFHWASAFNVNFILTLQHWKNIHMTQHNQLGLQYD